MTSRCLRDEVMGLTARLAVTADGETVRGVTHVLQKEQLRAAFAQGQGIAAAGQEDAVGHIARAPVGMASLVPGLGDGGITGRAEQFEVVLGQGHDDQLQPWARDDPAAQRTPGPAMERRRF